MPLGCGVRESAGGVPDYLETDGSLRHDMQRFLPKLSNNQRTSFASFDCPF